MIDRAKRCHLMRYEVLILEVSSVPAAQKGAQGVQALLELLPLRLVVSGSGNEGDPHKQDDDAE